MKRVIGTRVVVSLGVAAMLAGCGADVGSSGTPATVSEAARHVARSWMAPNTTSQDLLYITGACGGICVFSYPGGTLVGELADSNTPLGECVDKSGDVFVVDFGDDGGTAGVVEYAHGGTSPIATLSDPGYSPVACSIDPTTGNLAVTDDSFGSDGSGVVAIYADAKGDATNYTDPKVTYMNFCGYDDKGNLFVDGQYLGAFEFAEMLKGSSSFKRIKLAQAPASPLKLQWVGKYIALAASNTVIDHVAVKGSKGTVVGTTLLNGPASGSEGQFWIQGNTVISPYESGTGPAEIGFWKYPTGGRVRKNIDGSEFNDAEPVGTVVSPAQQQRFAVWPTSVGN